jgi:hypothetical protein
LANEFINSKWVQVEGKTRFGNGNIYTFNDQGFMEDHFGSLIVSRYTIKDNLLISFKAPPYPYVVNSRYEFSIEGNMLTIQKIVSYNPRELSEQVVYYRLDRNNSVTEPTIVGQWIVFPKGNVNLKVIREYTADGKELFYIPRYSKKGKYSIGDNNIKIQLNGSDPIDYSYHIEEDKLFLKDDKNIERVFDRF